MVLSLTAIPPPEHFGKGDPLVNTAAVVTVDIPPHILG